MEILINNEQTSIDVRGYEDLVARGFKIAARLEEIQTEIEVSLSFVDNAAIQELNRDFRGIESPTDVLSFPQADDENFAFIEGMPLVLGDIVISLERALEQAEEYGHSIEREVLYLAVHGFFHLLGYDHESPEDQKAMREREERVLGELDLGRE